MALSFGWKLNEKRYGIWKGDPALGTVPPEVLESWERDGQAAHLEPYAINGKAEVIEFRSLRIDETRGLLKPTTTVGQAYLDCFRLGVRFPRAQESWRAADGTTARVVTRDESGFPKLSLGFVEALEASYPGIVDFYGELIFAASFPSEPEKKASSPPSTPKLSLVAETTGAAGTAAPSAPAGPAA